MLTYEEAKIKGLNKCREILGAELVKKYSEYGSAAHGLVDNDVFCYVGFDTKEVEFPEGVLILSENKDDKFPYYASCYVALDDGTIRNIECVKPDETLLAV